MKFVADESVDAPIVSAMRAAGHQVVSITEVHPSISDDEVLALASEHEAPLITADTDFGELIFRLRRASHGIVLIRLAGLSPDAKTQLVVTAVNDHANELPHSFTVIAPGLIRIRKSLV